MKESEEKEMPLPDPGKGNLDPIEEVLKELREKGVPLREVPMEEGYTVWLNPPRFLVEKMQKAKQEEAAKKKK